MLFKTTTKVGLKINKKYGLKRERAMTRYFAQKPMQKNFDSGKTLEGSVDLRFRNIAIPKAVWIGQ